jgi:hypothetical protein
MPFRNAIAALSNQIVEHDHKMPIRGDLFKCCRSHLVLVVEITVPLMSDHIATSRDGDCGRVGDGSVGGSRIARGSIDAHSASSNINGGGDGDSSFGLADVIVATNGGCGRNSAGNERQGGQGGRIAIASVKTVSMTMSFDLQEE